MNIIFLLCSLPFAWSWKSHVHRDLGCWKNNAGSPALDYMDEFEVDFKAGANSIEKCAIIAAEKGWSIFGVQGDWFCGSAPDADVRYKKYGESNACLSYGVGGDDSIQVYEIDVMMNVQYQRLGCFLETPGSEPIPSIEKRFVELHDDPETRLDALEKCARSAEALGHRVFSVRAGGICSSSANAFLIYKTYNDVWKMNTTSTYNISSVYELTTGTKIQVEHYGCQEAIPPKIPSDIQSLENHANVMNPLSLRKDTVASCIRYAAGLKRSVIGVGGDGKCTASKSGNLDTYMELPMTMKCSLSAPKWDKNIYLVFTLKQEHIDYHKKVIDPPMPDYFSSLGCLETNAVDLPILSEEFDAAVQQNTTEARLQWCYDVAKAFGISTFGLTNRNVCVGTKDSYILANLAYSNDCKDIDGNNKVHLFTANVIYMKPTISGLGCYNDHIIPSIEGSLPLLKGNPRTRRNAISKCAKAAAMRGYPVFALNDEGCHSSPLAHLNYKNHGQAICNSNGKGYRDINQVYEIKNLKKITIKNLGCWKNDAFQTIPTAEGSIMELSDNYKRREDALEKCAEYAYKAGNDVFALQDGGMCMTSSNARYLYKRIGNSEDCKTDLKGGIWANQVFEILSSK